MFAQPNLHAFVMRSTIYFDNSAGVLLSVFSRDKRLGICILFTHPTAILDSLLYLSEEAFILAIARTIRITPTGVVVGKIRRFADTASPPGHFDTRHEHEFVQTAKTSAPTLRWEGEGEREKTKGRDSDNKRK